MVVVVVLSCHFSSPTELCGTTRRRLDAALRFAASLPDETLFIPSGGSVIYEHGGKSIGTLMAEYIAARGVPAERIRVGRGFNTFTEAAAIVDDLAASGTRPERIVVVSSVWHLWVARQVWRPLAQIAALQVEFLAVRGTGSWMMIRRYFAYAAAVKILTAIGEQRPLHRLGAERQDGFTANWCGR